MGCVNAPRSPVAQRDLWSWIRLQAGLGWWLLVGHFAMDPRRISRGWRLLKKDFNLSES